MARRNLYEVLGVPRTASEAEIRKAYRKLARDNHPDRNPDNVQAEERFKDASYARDVLQNKKKRELYDEFGEPGLRDGFDAESHRRYNSQRAAGPQGGFGGINLEDLFGNVQGGSGSFQDFINPGAADSVFGRRRQKPPLRDLVSDIQVSFAEAVQGAEKELSFTPPGKTEARTLRVRIPAGVDNGSKVRLRGQGTDGGDLVLHVRVDSHKHFTRDDKDLLLKLPLTLGEAYVGAKVPVPTPQGEVVLSIPAGVRSGAKLRLRGKGVTKKGTAGDLIVTLLVMVPEAGDGHVGELIQQLDAAYQTPVRADLTF